MDASTGLSNQYKISNLPHELNEKDITDEFIEDSEHIFIRFAEIYCYHNYKLLLSNSCIFVYRS